MGDKLIVLKPGQGTAQWMLGGLYDIKATGEETNNSLTVVEVTIPEGSGPPPHIHAGGEAVYVLEGRLRYRIGEDVVEAGTGAFLYFPAGTIESFEPIETVRLLLIYSPGGVDRFFVEAGEPAKTRTIPRQSAAPDMEKLTAIGAKHGLQLLAPNS